MNDAYQDFISFIYQMNVPVHTTQPPTYRPGVVQQSNELATTTSSSHQYSLQTEVTSW
jgi:hypothetical protein